MPLTRRRFFGWALAALGGLAAGGRASADDDEDDSGYSVAEWGVFVLRGDLPAGRAADLETDVPDFAHVPRRDRVDFLKAAHEAENAPIIVTKPVVWFRSPVARTVSMGVRFPGGQPLVWWPGAEWTEDRLAWSIDILGPGAAAPERAVDPDHWFAALRLDGPNPCRVDGIVEGFVYYDGQTELVGRLTAVEEDGRIVLASGHDHPLHDVVVAWNDRATGRPVARRSIGDLAPGGRAVVEPGVDTGPERLLADLRATGLPAEEAAAFVRVWSDEFFEAAGLSVAFRLPEPVYDRLLPLDLDPAPRGRVRVGYALAVDLDPDLGRMVAGLVDELGAERWTDRDAARARLSALGPSALPVLRAAAGGHADPHVRQAAIRLVALIEARYEPAEVPTRFRAWYDEWRRTGRIQRHPFFEED